MKENDILYIKKLLLEELHKKQEQYKKQQSYVLVKEIEYIKDLLERL